MQEQVSRQYVGIDLHRRRSVIVRLGQAGKVRVDNDPVELPWPWPRREKAPRWP
jgi:hypothetical protein